MSIGKHTIRDSCKFNYPQNIQVRSTMHFRPGAIWIRVPALLARTCHRFAGKIGELSGLVPMLASVSIAWPATVSGSELSGGITLASQYIYRGLAMSDHNPAVQAWIDFEHDSGFFAGTWASTVDLPNPAGRRDAELDFYAGYQFRTDSAFSATLALTRYTYPGQTGPIDYDYTEALVVLAYDDRYSAEFGYTGDLYGFGDPGRHAELRADWPLRNAVVVSAGLGYNDVEEVSAPSYWYWDLGATARFSWLTMDVRWCDNQAAGGYFGSMSAGSQAVISLSVAF